MPDPKSTIIASEILPKIGIFLYHSIFVGKSHRKSDKGPINPNTLLIAAKIPCIYIPLFPADSFVTFCYYSLYRNFSNSILYFVGDILQKMIFYLLVIIQYRQSLPQPHYPGYNQYLHIGIQTYDKNLPSIHQCHNIPLLYP